MAHVRNPEKGRPIEYADEQAAREKLMATKILVPPAQGKLVASPDPERFRDATVINAKGVRIGKIAGVSGGKVELELGGLQDVWGFWDMSSKQIIRVDAVELVFGPKKIIGLTLMVLPAP